MSSLYTTTHIYNGGTPKGPKDGIAKHTPN